MGEIRLMLQLFVALSLIVEIASGADLKKTQPELLLKTRHIAMPFVENKGQLHDPNILFYCRTFAGRVTVNSDGSIGYCLAGNTAGKEKQRYEIRENLIHALKASPSAGQKAIAKVNHFQGKDSKKWVADIPTFNSIDMGEIYQGVSLRLQAYANNVEKIFSVHPGANPNQIQLTIDGAKALRLNANGELEVNAGTDSIRFARPVAYQRIDGRQIPVDVAYTVKGRSYGFKLAAYDKSKELIIDPLIAGIDKGTSYITTIPNCLTADRHGNIYAAGLSGGDLAVFKFDSQLKTLVNAAFFSSASSTYGERMPNVYDITVDRHDAVYLVGATQDKYFPVTQGAFDTSFGGGEKAWLRSDGFVIKFDTDLKTILSSTFVGEDGFDAAYGVAIATDDTVYVVGKTAGPPANATPFPTTPDAYDTSGAVTNKIKAFVMRLDNGLQTMLASTLLGDNGDTASDQQWGDRAYDVAIDDRGAVVVAGMTESEHFPLTENCADAVFQGESEAFISKFDPELKQLLASTFLGGADKDKANVLGLAADNEIVIAGWTMSPDFPVVQGNYDTTHSGAHEDGFVSKLNSDLTTISASTFLGGNSHEQVSDMVIGDDGTVFLCGGTGSSDFPVTENAYDSSFNSSAANSFYDGDGFITILDRTLTILDASTYVGGNNGDHITSMVLNRDEIIVAGEGRSWNFPEMTVRAGGAEAFLCRFGANAILGPRQFTGRPGHWRSYRTGHAALLYLDVNICDDGFFSGIMQEYPCDTPDEPCDLPENAPSKPVTGKIDLKNLVGTITLNDDCKAVPIRIIQQTPEMFGFDIDPESSEGDCLGGSQSYLRHLGEHQAGKCQTSPGSGESGDGCFLNAMSDPTPLEDRIQRHTFKEMELQAAQRPLVTRSIADQVDKVLDLAR